MPYFAGIDWASQTHAVCVVDDRGAVVAAFEVAHDAKGLAELTRKLARCGEALRIAIERPSGLLVDALVAAGHAVVPIHPNVVAAARPRYRAALSKSDPGDAHLLADLLRTDGHRFRTLPPLSDEIQALRALVRTRDELVAERIALANPLRALLESFWPGAAAIFAEIDSPIALAFLERYPLPEAAASLGEKRLATEAGVAPVTKASGKHHAVRWACNHRLRRALTCFADNSRHASPWAAAVYQRARGRGCDHPHAVRILARAWLRVLWRAWCDQQPYQPERHRALQQLQAAA